jgi:(1->4)-alpha-D-glucan 1-alpha-D-glucosylmutase
MLVTAMALRFRRQSADLFGRGKYVPLEAAGQRSKQIVAFMRENEQSAVIVSTGRFFTQLADGAGHPTGRVWGDTAVLVPPPWRGRSVRDVFTRETFLLTGSDGASIEVARAFSHLPVTMLEVLP